MCKLFHAESAKFAKLYVRKFLLSLQATRAVKVVAIAVRMVMGMHSQVEMLLKVPILFRLQSTDYRV